MRKAATKIVFTIVLVLATIGIARADCQSYDGLRLRVLQGDVYCGDSGPGCTECYDYNQGGYYGSCYFMPSTGSMVCTDGGGHIYYAN